MLFILFALIQIKLLHHTACLQQLYRIIIWSVTFSCLSVVLSYERGISIQASVLYWARNFVVKCHVLASLFGMKELTWEKASCLSPFPVCIWKSRTRVFMGCCMGGGMESQLSFQKEPRGGFHLQRRAQSVIDRREVRVTVFPVSHTQMIMAPMLMEAPASL